MKLSAIRSVFGQMLIQASVALLILLTPAWAQGEPCVPSPAIRVQLDKIKVVVAGPSDFDRGLAPLRTLRQQHPSDLWVNERYQDAVQQYGIEGHLRRLTEEYQVLSMQHPDELTYSYLYARSLMGRNTASAIQQMTEIIANHPDFAPAHQSLAEIYSSSAFHDESKEKTERERFLASCPESSLQQRRTGLPDPSPLVDEAEHMLAQNGDPERVAAMAVQGIREDEWRLQRIRPFDWYSVAYKRQAQRELQAKYWRVWSLQVRCERRAGRPEKAAELLAVMDQRTASLRSSDPAYWDVLSTLARLYEEGSQKDMANRKLDSMQEFLTAHPDPTRAAQLAELRALSEKSDQ
ncbi:MAG: hypothetical protein LAO18_06230 [Acidobacteriia bacterium]|nr:hypothetical protein [Terriglobia bacterium]